MEYQTAINFRDNQLDSRGRRVRIMCGWTESRSIADGLRLMHWKI